MRWTEQDSVSYLIPFWATEGVVMAFSTRLGGVSAGPFAWLNMGGRVGDDPANIAENRRRFYRAIRVSNVTYPTQVHGDRIVRLDGLPAAREQADALVTAVPGLAVGCMYADCVPVGLYDPVNRAVAVIHAGWRGTALDIARKTVEVMRAEFGSRARDLFGVIAPSIGGCCYQVDDAVRRAMTDADPEYAFAFTPDTPGHYRCDLQRINQMSLLKAGVREENIDVSGLCTHCDPRFYSYRRDGRATGRMALVACVERI
ncbi:MAG: peptidoglycan editing factor PgeF [Bacillota bacterium]